MRTGLAAVLSALVLSTGALAEDQCRLTRVTTMVMGFDGAGGPTIPMIVKGRTLKMLVDTGGFASMLTRRVARELELKSEPMHGATAVGFGGVRFDRMVTVRDIQFGTLNSPKATLFLMPDDLAASDVDGTLAPDYFAQFDVDFDFVGGRLSLFSPDHCKGRVVYWTQDDDAVAKIPFESDFTKHILFHAKLDGRDVSVLLDTGASISVLHLGALEDKFGVNANSPGMKPSGDELKNSYRYGFKTLALDGVTINNPNILVADDPRGIGRYGTDLVLGMTALRQMHLYIAYKEKMLYVTGANVR